MPQSTRKNRNDANPPAMPPLDFAAAAGVSGFPTDNSDQFHMNNSGYAGFGNAFTNPFHASRSNASHHQSGTFNQNPFGMSGFGMTAPYTNAYPSYGMTMGQSMKHQHTDNAQRQHHGHNQHHDTSFGQVTAFSSDPSISFISQTATNTNPYTQSTTASNPQSHHNFDTLTTSRHKNTNPSTTYDPFSNPSHSASDLFATSSHRRHHAPSSSQADLSVLTYGTGSNSNTNNNQNNGNGNSNNNNGNGNNTRNSLRSSHYNSSTSNATKHNEYVKHAFASPNLIRSTPHRQMNNQSNNQHIFGRYYNPSNSANTTFTDPTQQHLYTNSFGLLAPTYSHSKKGTHSKSTRTHSTGSPRKINRSKSYSSPKKAFRASNRLKNKSVYDNNSGFFPFQSSILHKSSKLSEVTGVARLSLQHNPPVDGCNIEPYVILSCENGGFIQSDDKDCRFTWYRSKKRICFAENCTKPAFLQCLSCSKLQIEHNSSYYCSTQCMKDGWNKHRDYHKLKKYDLTKWNSNDTESVTNEWKVKNAKECAKHAENTDTLYCKFPPPIINKWEKIHNNTSKRYKPRSDDIGRQLLLECAPTIKKTKAKEKKDIKIKKKKRSIINECQDTSPCLPRPQLSHNRLMHYYHPEHPSDQDSVSFRVLSYNCLAPIYCTRAMYPYVEAYKLEWDYRKYNIKREILRYKADVICLQEVQHNHFEDYFTKELSKEGYEGMYRPKSRGSRDPKSVDGCAIFFKSNRFKVSSRYHIDFNDTSSLYLNMLQNQASESAKPMTEEQVKLMSKRLNKGNIAMIVVLEEKERKSSADKEDIDSVDIDIDDNTDNKDNKTSINISDHNISISTSVKKQICIANTHVYWDPQFTDVKLWQAWILCEEIWRALGRELPLILCGDFNSEPNSAVYQYLTKGRVDATMYEQLVKDYEIKKNCVLPPRDHLRHRLGLKSHYNKNGEEPNYTNYTRHYKGTLDYVLYSSKSIEAIGYLQELAESELMKEEAFPNSLNSSDHIPLMGTFAFARDYQNWQRERRQTQTQSQHISSKSSKYHHHHHQHHPQHSHSRASSSRFVSSTSSNSNSTIRPSAPPRHRHNVNQSPQHSRIIPGPSSITKSQSSTHPNKHSFPTTHRRHHSLEILQNTNTTSNTNQSASNTNTTSSERRTVIDVIPPHIHDDDDADTIDEKVGAIVKILEKRKEINMQQQNEALKTFYNPSYYDRNQNQRVIYPQIPYSKQQQTAYTLYQQQMRRKMKMIKLKHSQQIQQKNVNYISSAPTAPNKTKSKGKPRKYDDDFKCTSK